MMGAFPQGQVCAKPGGGEGPLLPLVGRIPAVLEKTGRRTLGPRVPGGDARPPRPGWDQCP